MRIVIALGGQALLWRSAPMTTEVQRRNARVAAQAIAPLAAEHSIVVVHGNGPQVSPLALQAESYPGAVSGAGITAGAEAGEATPHTTWSPACGSPRPMAGAG
jgi:carbamate kinase